MQQSSVLTAIGLMSGTSMDGIDAALIRSDGVCWVEEIAATHISYAPQFQFLLKAAEFAVNQHHGNMPLARSHFTQYLHQFKQIQAQSIHDLPDVSLDEIFAQSLELHYAAVVKLLEQVTLQAQDIDVVGYHGQTLYHDPSNKISIQIGDGRELARRLNISVINNFRENDLLNGGQGAPLAPIYHQALAQRDGIMPCIVINCGGIANLSLISSDHCHDLIGYDAGPGNGLLDRFVQQRTTETCDRDGKFGLKGKVNPQILQLLFDKSCVKHDKNYFNLTPPKSLDIGDFQLIPELETLSLEDGCATLAAFTAQMIVDSIKIIADSHRFTNWILAGGGWKNPNITQNLKYYAHNFNPKIEIKQARDIGWDSDGLEAQLMAFLAIRRLRKLPISFPGTTAVPAPTIGGDIHVIQKVLPLTTA